NRLLIYINEVQDTRYVDDTRKYVDPNNVPARDRGRLAESTANRTRIRQSARNLNIGAFLLGGAVAGIPVGQTAVGAYVADTGTKALVNVAPKAEVPVRRLRTAIALHMPNKLNIKYETQWDESNTYLLSALLDANPAINEAVDAALRGKIDDVSTRGQGVSEKGIAGTLKDLANTNIGRGLLSNIALANPLAGDSLSAATRLANNPKKEQIFQGVGFRSFSLEYDFFARSQREANDIKKIIYQLKYHMHPELKANTGDFLWTYPSEFDLEYVQGGGDDTIHRHTSCILVSLDVDYTSDGMFTQLAGGELPKIKIMMEFKELALLDKAKIKERNY
ncbi:MAG: hypothetical protein HAW67_07335, partial [Endozoicomonadaceae bacterium]|nr:hypothetical protein [Endozoicomonadaceae bacterium]